jgi:trehalose-phosphatase
MLDYDGTLAPFCPDLRAVVPYDGVTDCLNALLEADGARLIVVTGRFLKEAPPALGTRSSPEFWGSHGRERLLPDGSYAVTGIDVAALRALTVADTWAPMVEAAGGRCEAKPGSLAFHWRGADPGGVAIIRRLVTEGFHREALVGVLDLHSFDGGLELRAPGPGKGDVVRTILGETPADVPVAYLGDDLTDEDAFAALKGRGLGVLVRPEHRTTGADLWVRPPDELVALLRRWTELLRSRP